MKLFPGALPIPRLFPLLMGALAFPLVASPLRVTVGRDPAPAELRAVYLSYWSASSSTKIDQIVEMARAGLINGVVVDVKDVTGRVAFDTTAPEASSNGAREVILRNVGALVARLHAEGLYVAARITVFADPKFATAHPEFAVHSASDPDALWRDRRGLAWVDPAAQPAWEYNAAIAKDAWSRGFDEINFDYIRFPSDGLLADMSFPVWRESGPRRATLQKFFAYLRTELGDAVISADLFGLSTVNRDDLGIGQVIEDAYEYFDYVCPMVYPSHYAPGFLGKQNPADFPYDVVLYSLREANRRLTIQGGRARLRPWLQDFDLGADYTPEMVQAEMNASRDALGAAYTGFVLWNPRNVYQEQALGPAGR